MASTINATTTSGVVVTPDNSGNLQLQWNGQAAPAFSAYASSATTLSTGAWGKIGLQTISFDTNNNFSTANSRFTPTVAGYYQFNGCVWFGTSGAAQQDAVAIYKNGTRVQIGPYTPDPGNISLRVSMSTILYMNGSTDYVELWAVYNAGPSTQAQGTGSDATYFSGCLIRGA